MNINGIRVLTGVGTSRPVRAEDNSYWRYRQYESVDREQDWMLIGEPADAPLVADRDTTREPRRTDTDSRYYCEMFEPEATEVTPVPPETTALPYLLAVGWTPKEGTSEDYHAWFWQEHKPDLLAVPGWAYVRRFVRVRGDGPEYVAIHYLRDLAVFDHPSYKRMQTSEWRDRVMLNRIEHNRFLGQLIDASV